MVDVVTAVMEYESGNLSDWETLELFSHLFKSGMYNQLQGHYSRATVDLMNQGLLTYDGEIAVEIAESKGIFKPQTT